MSVPDCTTWELVSTSARLPSTMTPEPRLTRLRALLGMPKSPKNCSSGDRALPPCTLVLVIFTTAGEALLTTRTTGVVRTSDRAWGEEGAHKRPDRMRHARQRDLNTVETPSFQMNGC